MSLKKILAICGSTRKTSSNLNLIHAIAELAKEKFEINTITKNVNFSISIILTPIKINM